MKIAITRKWIHIAGIFAALILLLLATIYLLRIKADTLTENLNTSLKLYRVPLYSDAESDTPLDSSISLSVPQGETTAFEILLKNNGTTTYSNFSIAKTDLLSSSNDIISKDNIDERVIHVWDKKYRPRSFPGPASTDCLQTTKTEELLVRNEKPNLTAPTDPKYNGDTFFSNDIGALTSDLLRQTGYAQSESGSEIKTTINANSEKKFYFTISAPKNKSGTYTSTVSFVDKTSNSIVAKFNISLKIYNFNLAKVEDSSFIEGTYLNDQIRNELEPPSTSAHSYFDQELFNTRLNILKKHGVTSLVIRAGRYTDSFAMIKLINDKGFKGPLIINFYGSLPDNRLDLDATLTSQTDKNDFKAMLEKIKNDPTITIPILFYGLDEANSATDQPLHKEKAANIQTLINEVYQNAPLGSVIPQVTTSATAETFNLFQNESATKTSYPINNLIHPSLLEKVNSVNNQSETAQSGDSYYFQGWHQIQWPDHTFIPSNRYYAGIGLAKSGLHGAYVNPVYGYNGVNTRPLYDDFAYTGCSKAMLTFVPASDGLMPTMQSESWREGIMDLRYYLEYQKITKLVKSSSVNQALSPISNQITQSLADYKFDSTSPVGLPSTLTTEEMNETRALLEQYIFTYYSQEKPVLISANVQNNQIINKNPYIIMAKFENPELISKVEFYIDGNLIGTSTLPDVSGYFEANWDTSKYHSAVKIVAYSAEGQRSESEFTTTVDLSSPQPANNDPLLFKLPSTGAN